MPRSLCALSLSRGRSLADSTTCSVLPRAHFLTSLRNRDLVGREKALQVKEGCSVEYCTSISLHSSPLRRKKEDYHSLSNLFSYSSCCFLLFNMVITYPTPICKITVLHTNDESVLKTDTKAPRTEPIPPFYKRTKQGPSRPQKSVKNAFRK